MFVSSGLHIKKSKLLFKFTKLAVFLELRSRKTVRFSKQIMSE